jgi:hypothetical protein
MRRIPTLTLSLVAVAAGAALLLRAGGWAPFVHADAPIAASTTRSFTGAIGVQVFRNPNRLDPMSWYRSQDFRQGEPHGASVDGFPGLEEGSSVYVSAPNFVRALPKPSAYVNVYLLSYGQGSDAATVEIARRLRSNWQFLQTIPPNEHDGPALAREELRHDNTRLTSLGTMVQQLQQYRQQHGSYPDLAAGTYLPGQSVSTWPSWLGAYSASLGAPAPTDPINNFDTVWPYDGPSECDTARGFATGTCFASPGTPGGGSNGAYSCPDGSHVFEYAFRNATSTGLYANFEFKNILWPSGLPHSTVDVDPTANGCHSYFIDLNASGPSWGGAWSAS